MSGTTSNYTGVILVAVSGRAANWAEGDRDVASTLDARYGDYLDPVLPNDECVYHMFRGLLMNNKLSFGYVNGARYNELNVASPNSRFLVSSIF